MKPSQFVLTLLALTPMIGLGCRGDEVPGVANTAANSLIGRQAGQVRDDNGLKMKFAWCPAGTVTMEQVDVADESAAGSDAAPKDPPVSKVTPVKATLTHGYWIGTCEVTQGQWTQVMATEPWKDKKELPAEGPDLPVTCVNWFDAMEFCCRLTRQERMAGRLPDGWEYTLPTEAQWEYACRAGTETRFSFGDDPAKVVEYAWIYDNTSRLGERWSQRVGQKKPNGWGLYDMYGNAIEWCRDVSGKLPGGEDPEVSDASEGWRRVVRGGCWNDVALTCASSHREEISPIPRGNVLGFRTALRPGDDKLTAAALKDLKDSVPALRETPDSLARTSQVARQAGVLPGDSPEVAKAIIGIDVVGGEIRRDFNRRDAAVVQVEFGASNRFKDEDLALLTPLTSTLRELGLSHSASDATLPPLAALPELRILWLFDTDVTDTGVKSLSGIRNLEKLCLTSTAITDAGLKDLAELPKVKVLDLANTEITDAGLRQLAKLRALTELDLTGTKVTEAGRRELEDALPGLKIATWEAEPAAAREISPLVGTPSEAWNASDLEGKTHTLEDCRGKVLILDFWYRNCGWCVRAMPQVKEVAAHFQGRPVVVFGMNTDEKEEDALFIVKKMGLAYPTLRAAAVTEKYKVDGFPTLIILDQEGIIRDIHTGYSPTLRDEVIEVVERLLTRGN